MTRQAGEALTEEERVKWDYIPFESVGPLRFGMTHDEVVAALEETPSIVVPYSGHTPSFESYKSRLAMFYETEVTTYYDGPGFLFCIAIDALHGPQVTLDGMQLVGRTPSAVAKEFFEYAFSHDVQAFTSQQGDPGADELGLVMRAQRCGDILLTRPVFVARKWAERVADVEEGAVPQTEWQER